MSDIIYRKATIQDVEKISHQVAISYKAAYKGLMREQYLSSLPSDHWIPILQGAIAADNTCLVAENSAKIIGSVVFGKSAAEPYSDSAELFAIYLLPEYIGFGVGHKLYSEAEKMMMVQGFTGCLLEVLSENTQAIDFYSSHGFDEINLFTVEENGMTLICKTMRKELKI